MTKRLIISTLLLLAAVGASAQYERQGEAGAESNAPWEQIASQRRQLFNFDWKFRLGAFEGAEAPALDDSAWRTLDLPHDFQFEQPWREDTKSMRHGFLQVILRSQRTPGAVTVSLNAPSLKKTLTLETK